MHICWWEICCLEKVGLTHTVAVESWFSLVVTKFGDKASEPGTGGIMGSAPGMINSGMTPPPGRERSASLMCSDK
jgi:hypothetical protein